MKFLSNWLLQHFVLMGFLFAAGAPPLNGEMGSGEGESGGDLYDGGTDDAGADDGAVDDAADSEGDADADVRRADADKQDDKEEPEVKEFRGHASNRIRKLITASPKLAEALKENPKIQAEIEASFRRDSAYRELFPTVSEARQMREHFPNGLQDVQALQSEVQEVEELDNNFYKADRDGSYPGHEKVIQNIFQNDRNAAVSLFKTLPKQWAQLDKESYNEVMGSIVGATLQNAGIIEYLADMREAAKAAGQKDVEAGLGKLLNWAEGFNKEKPRPTPEQEQLKRDRAALDREKGDRAKEEGQRFNSSFVSESKKLQVGIVRSHPAINRVLEAKNLSDGKKAEIVEQVRKSIEQLLGKSPAFMNKLRPLHAARNLDEVIKLQKSAWSQQWLLNRMVRSVLSKEVPQIVSNNREAVRRRAGAPAAKPNFNAPDKNKNNSPQGATQIGGRWYREGGKGAPYTTAEILAGKHLK